MDTELKEYVFIPSPYNEQQNQPLLKPVFSIQNTPYIYPTIQSSTVVQPSICKPSLYIEKREQTKYKICSKYTPVMKAIISTPNGLFIQGLKTTKQLNNGYEEWIIQWYQNKKGNWFSLKSVMDSRLLCINDKLILENTKQLQKNHMFCLVEYKKEDGFVAIQSAVKKVKIFDKCLITILSRMKNIVSCV